MRPVDDHPADADDREALASGLDLYHQQPGACDQPSALLAQANVMLLVAPLQRRHPGTVPRILLVLLELGAELIGQDAELHELHPSIEADARVIVRAWAPPR